MLQAQPNVTVRAPIVRKQNAYVVLLRPKTFSTSEDKRKLVEMALCNRNSAARISKISKVNLKGVDPRIILLGIDNDVDKDRLAKGLAAKNHFLYDVQNNPLFQIVFPIRARKTTNWVITLDPRIYKRVFGEPGLFFEWSRYRFDNFIGVKQCRHCRKFGHTTKWCPRSEEALCGNCGLNHKSEDCQQVICVNCYDSNQKYNSGFDTGRHPYSITCECFLRQKVNLIRLADYGDPSGSTD
ncbi:hypothetical protein AVEN_37465-1 [Araneus ventricosus]|uniref:CCHC-type domain-containing protein n=1 Tax=Araneus ventricosus TaxID=182803 RepID=A0A4Y2FBV5_ARAVE|nr:hypothetical protein AVEN_37465-1 [Araneus ventricosus]